MSGDWVGVATDITNEHLLIAASSFNGLQGVICLTESKR
jgi:hypothetical protein